MNEKELQQELATLEEKIAELPIGYISKKMILGKERYYLRWTENGKREERYISEAIEEELRPKIEERKKLQKRVKEINALLAVKKAKPSTEKLQFQTSLSSTLCKQALEIK